MLTDNDLSALKRGWKLAFGDDDEFIDRFFSLYDNDDTRFVKRNERGDVVAQLHCFVFDDDLCGEKGSYIYGVATLPEYRGRGLARELIAETLEQMRARGVGYTMLIAEKEELQEWYKRQGFTLKSGVLEICGEKDGMNFALDDTSKNQGMYYVFKPSITGFTKQVKIKNYYKAN